jgi:PKD repeat protein
MNDSPVSGATSNSWTFALQPIGNYSVYINVTDSLGSIAKSNEASVTVVPQLAVSISPMSASMLVGQSIQFTSTASGGYLPYSYQWYLNGNPVSGVVATIWTFTPTTSGIYYIHLKVTDAKANTAQSETARITVATVPVGGYSFPIQVQTKAEPVLPYIALIAALTAIFTKLRPKTKRKH